MGSTQFLGKDFFAAIAAKMARSDSRKRSVFNTTVSIVGGSAASKGRRRDARSSVTTWASTRKETNSSQERSRPAEAVFAKSRARRPAMREEDLAIVIPPVNSRPA